MNRSMSIYRFILLGRMLTKPKNKQKKKKKKTNVSSTEELSTDTWRFRRLKDSLIFHPTKRRKKRSAAMQFFILINLWTCTMQSSGYHAMLDLCWFICAFIIMHSIFILFRPFLKPFEVHWKETKRFSFFIPGRSMGLRFEHFYHCSIMNCVPFHFFSSNELYLLSSSISAIFSIANHICFVFLSYICHQFKPHCTLFDGCQLLIIYIRADCISN